MEQIKKYFNYGKEKINTEWNNLKKNIKNIKHINILELLSDSKIILCSFAFVLIFFLLIFMNLFRNDKYDTLISMKNGLLNGKTNVLSKYVTIDGEKVSSHELEPLAQYYIGEEERINKIYTELNQSGNSGIFTLTTKKVFFSEKYYVNINKVELTLTSELEGIDVVVGNKKFQLKDQAIIDVIPGTYEITYKYKSDFGDINGSKNITITEDLKQSLDLPVNYITLYSNFEDSKVYINGEKTDLTAKEMKNYGPIPMDKEIVLYIEKEFPWGILRSDEVKINEELYIKLDINMVNDTLVSEVEAIVDEFYNSVFEALNKKDETIINSCTDKVRSTVYDYINEKTLIFSNNYEISEMNVEIEKSDFKFEDDKYKASVVTKIDYTVSKKLLPFLKEQQESHFILNLEYSDIGFVVNGIQKIEL